jgi:hypothetical protein
MHCTTNQRPSCFRHRRGFQKEDYVSRSKSMIRGGSLVPVRRSDDDINGSRQGGISVGDVGQRPHEVLSTKPHRAHRASEIRIDRLTAPRGSIILNNVFLQDDRGLANDEGSSQPPRRRLPGQRRRRRLNRRQRSHLRWRPPNEGVTTIDTCQLLIACR